MGFDKATTVFFGRTLIEHVYDVAKRVFTDIMIVTSNHNNLKGVEGRILRDIVSVRSPISGILTSLVGSLCDYTFVLACDMPFITENSLRCVLDSLEGEDIVVPRTNKGFEPLHAIYRRRCIPFLVKLLDSGFMKIQSVFSYVELKIVEDNPSFYNGGVSVFTNINTQEDLKNFSAFFSNE